MSRPLFDPGHAFDHPVVLGATVGVVAGMVGSIGIAWLLHRAGKLGRPTYDDIVKRWKSWVWLIALMLGPILLGAGPVMLAVLALSLLCYREYARVTGIFRDRAISLVVVAGILVLSFASFDHFDRLFFATSVLTCGLIAVVTIPRDAPAGYIQRVALGVLGFMLFGFSFAYLGYIANDSLYRPLLILILLATELNDVFAYVTGKAIGGRKLLPVTSPGKTVAGCVGALVLTTCLVAGVGRFLFEGLPWHVLLLLGLMISALGQCGDLMLSSIKRDVGVKDTGATIPGHGGLLDRFDSLVLVPPAVFHFLSLHLGPLGGPSQRYFTGP
jgi:phosphatidate cytidylyltransferase